MGHLCNFHEYQCDVTMTCDKHNMTQYYVLDNQFPATMHFELGKSARWKLRYGKKRFSFLTIFGSPNEEKG